MDDPVTYYITVNATGRDYRCPVGKTAEYYRMVELLTGWDAAIAGLILRSGLPIEHAAYTFRCRAGAIPPDREE